MTPAAQRPLGPREDDLPVDHSLYDLTLFVSGASDRSARAIVDARRLCDDDLAGRLRLSVVDVHDDPAASHASGGHAVPTLVRTGPPPVRRLVGDLSDAGKVLRTLGLPLDIPVTRPPT
jgi:circadian clock protein KaiB